MRQNNEKAVCIIRAGGRGANRITRDMHYNYPGMQQHARYLGPMMSYGNNITHEVQNRVKKAWGTFVMYGRLWSSGVPFEFKKKRF